MSRPLSSRVAAFSVITSLGWYIQGFSNCVSISSRPVRPTPPAFGRNFTPGATTAPGSRRVGPISASCPAVRCCEMSCGTVPEVKATTQLRAALLVHEPNSPRTTARRQPTSKEVTESGTGRDAQRPHADPWAKGRAVKLVLDATTQAVCRGDRHLDRSVGAGQSEDCEHWSLAFNSPEVKIELAEYKTGYVIKLRRFFSYSQSMFYTKYLFLVSRFLLPK